MCSNTNFAVQCLRLEPVIVVVMDAVVNVVGGGGNKVPTLQQRPLRRGGDGDIMNRTVWWADGGLEASGSDVDGPKMEEHNAISRRDCAIFIIIKCFCCR